MEIVSNKKPVNHVFHKTHGVCRHTSCWTSKLCPPEMLSDLYGQNIWWRICFLLAGDISRSGMHHMSGCGFLTTDNLLFGVMVLVFLNPKNGITVIFGHNLTNPGSIPSPPPNTPQKTLRFWTNHRSHHFESKTRKSGETRNSRTPDFNPLPQYSI